MGVLAISDSNTKGIKGPAVNGTPFYAFMKATGQSKKDNQTASGSYGIGKFAPYAVSSLRTVFVSTIYCGDDGKWQQLTQGKSVLMSHKKNGQLRRGVGFWGVCDKCKPISGALGQVNDGWLQRAENAQDYPVKKGTNIVVLGFESVNDWCKLLAVSVAENFFGAIAGNKLTVNIDDQITLSSANIRGFFDNTEMLRAVQSQKNEPDRFRNCSDYLKALQDNTEVQVEETEHHDLGLCRVRILVGEGLPKKVCVLRNGMLITDELSRLRSFPDFKEFVAVIECRSTKGNQFLRDMEPPRHDDFEPDRLSTPKQQRIGKRALTELANWVREMLKRHAKDPTSARTTLDELKDFFGDELSGASGNEGGETNPSGKVIIRARPLPRKSLEQSASGGSTEEGGGGGGEEGGGTDDGGGRGEGGRGGGGDGGGRGGGEGGKGGGGCGGGGGEPGSGRDMAGGQVNKPSKKLNNVRALMTGPDLRNVSFTPTASGPIRLCLMGAGADTDHGINIVGSNGGLVEGGCIIMNATAGSRTTLEVKLEKKFDGSIKVVAYEV